MGFFAGGSLILLQWLILPLRFSVSSLGGDGRESEKEMEMDDESLSLFLCEESVTCFDEDEEEMFVDDSISFRTDFHIEEEEEEEYVNKLFDRETSSRRFRHDDDKWSSGDWIKRARVEAFSWILRVGPLSIQSSDNIFPRCLY